MLLSGSLAGAGYKSQSRTSEMSLRRFVRQSFFHGVLFEEASRYRSDRDVATLVSLLNDRAESFYWRNVVAILGMGRNPRATAALIAFIERGSGKLSREEYTAKSAAVISLGYLAGRDTRALDYLLKSVNPAAWSRRLGWLSPYADQSDTRNLQLTKSAIQALGLSGHPQAMRGLLELQQSESLKIYQTDESLRELVDEALKSNEAVRKRGDAAYTRKEPRP
ncbi:MAG: hypothetical protein QOJ70_3570 [Acidobacteriota bacterium]|jgi:HEAT repeat protein|nr:hypothetical protein [Acidobacteriota bacterium]